MIALAAIFLGLLLFFRDPQASRVYLPCVFRAVTGIHCAGCGTARGLHALLQVIAPGTGVPPAARVTMHLRRISPQSTSMAQYLEQLLPTQT